MVVALAMIAWLLVALVVAMFVGAGVHGPDQPRRLTRRYVPDHHHPAPVRAASAGHPVLYVVDRSERRPPGSATAG